MGPKGMPLLGRKLRLRSVYDSPRKYRLNARFATGTNTNFVAIMSRLDRNEGHWRTLSSAELKIDVAFSICSNRLLRVAEANSLGT